MNCIFVTYDNRNLIKHVFIVSSGKGVHGMKNKYRIVILFILMFMTMTGCSRIIPEEKSTTPTPIVTAILSPTPVPTEPLEEVSSPNIELTAKELMIYSISSNRKDISSVTALVTAEEITPQLIVDTVVDSMEDASFLVDVNEVITQEDIIIVDFNKNSPPVVNVSKDAETAILDAIAQSLLDNLGDYHKVIYRVEGEAYSSKYRSFAFDYVYIEK